MAVAWVEHLKMPPDSDPIRKVVASSLLNEIHVTPISWSPRRARIDRGRLSVSSTNLRAIFYHQFWRDDKPTEYPMEKQ